MPNTLTALGLTTATRAELVTFYTSKFQEIYGFDINLDSNTPDGQLMNIFIQGVLDMQDLLVQIYNSFDPDNAIGNVLDQRVAINGIQRQAGTHTITPITLINSQSVNLFGVDQTVHAPYTIADNAGNNWELVTSQIGLAAGTHILDFRAALPGANLTVPNTINVPVTIVLGVTSVNNPTTYTTLGVNEESDVLLKVRRQKSVSIVSQGYLAGLLAALEALDGMDSAFVYENSTSTTDVDGVPGHSIWVVVSGTATAADIANAIYTKRNAGCGMFGDTTYTVTQIDGSAFVVKWDAVEPEDLFIKFTVTPIDGVTPPDIAAIRAGLVTELALAVNEEININEVATKVQGLDANTLVTDAGLSAAGTQTLDLSGVAASGAFTLKYGSYETTSLAWNDIAATIETALQALPGLTTAAVSGSIASQSLVIDLTGETVTGLITVGANTLQTSGVVDITFSYDEDYQNILSPTTKRQQFVVAAENIIILPMQFSPSAATVAPLGTQQFEGLGGYGDLVYTLSVDNSGGSINASTGLYTAGSTPSVTDTILVTDAMGNTASADIAVTT